MKIVRARLKPLGGVTEFINLSGRIKGLIEKNKGEEFHFVIDEDGVKTVKPFGPEDINEELVGKTIEIDNSPWLVQFNEDGTIDVVLSKLTNESLPREQSVDQLKKVMKQSAKTDIGNRISDMNKQGANIQYIQNPIDSGIESYEDFEKKNKKFIPSWNLKHLLSPFSGEGKKKK
jgi:hypothetical protein